MRFADLKPSLSAPSLQALSELGFVRPTPVQAATIPLFLQHKDVCVDATTGSGKTLAFGIPIFEMLSKQSPALGKHDVGALVLSPTRELAVQIFEVLSHFSRFHEGLRCVLLVGGSSVSNDAAEYTSNGGQVIIATPGRILDMKTRLATTISFRRLEVLVLDEADKLLDMGFQESINQILSFLPKQRRTGLFSATQTKEVKELARAGLRNPVIVAVTVQNSATAADEASSSSSGPGKSTPGQVIPSTLKNWYLVREYDDRIHELVNFFCTHADQKIIVFCATCACVDYYSALFHQITREYPMVLPAGFEVVGFHGKMVAKKRTLSYRHFKALPNGGVMFSTDVAARGIDIPDVDWIVQLTAPKDPAFFVHRVGRTARAGKHGQAVIFLTAEESPYLALLRGRGVPLHDADDRSILGAELVTQPRTVVTGLPDQAYGSVKVPYRPSFAVLNVLKALAKTDRAFLEMASAAFVAFVRAYTEHLCSYIFRLAELDIGAVARAYGLLRLPKMAETRGVRGKPILFDTDPISTVTIAYRNPAQEQARQRKLAQVLADEEAEEAEELRLQELENQHRAVRFLGEDVGGDEDEGADSDCGADSDAAAGSGDENEDENEDDSGADSDAAAAVAVAAAAAVTKAKVKPPMKASDAMSVRTSKTSRTGQAKVAWIPEERYKELLVEKKGEKGRLVAMADGTLMTEKRQRKRKQSFVQKFKAEWDGIADEEALYRRFKKGKISKAEYDERLLAVEDRGDGDGDDDDDDDDAPVSRKKAKKANIQAAAGKKVDYRAKKRVGGGRPGSR